MAALTQVSEDNRPSFFRPIARDLLQSLATDGDQQTVSSAKCSLNGVIKNLLHNAGTLDTDTDFQLEIVDKDGVTVYTEASISHNARTPTNLTLDNTLWLSGDEYTIKWTWTTAQTLAAAFFEVLLFPAVDLL